jgi:poly(3-hydroxybutyrate) depolymerase
MAGRVRSLALTAVGFATLIGAAGEPAAEALARYNIDPRQISVSGISSGAFMAHQFHVAHSATVIGAGIIAGGPYNCATSELYVSIDTAVTRCSAYLAEQCGGFETLCRAVWGFVPGSRPGDIYQGPRTAAEVRALAERSAADARAAAARGAIDPVENLRDSRVYLFSAAADSLVPRPVVDAAAAFYTVGMGVDPVRIRYVNTVDTIHAMVTDDFSRASESGRINECREGGLPLINDCGERYPGDADVAGELLRHLYGEAAGERAPRTGRIVRFSQEDFLPRAGRWGMGGEGYAYVPAACAEGRRCRLHVAFHGCKQYAGRIDTRFVEYAGYNEWADLYKVIVLYPQTAPVTLFLPARQPVPEFHCDNLRINPNGCWDWAGFTGADYATKAAVQIRTVKAMIDHLAGLIGPPAGLRVGREGQVADLAWTALTAETVIGYNVYRSERHPPAIEAGSRRNREPLPAPSFRDSDLDPARDYFYVVTAVTAGGEETAPSLPVSTHRLCELCLCASLTGPPVCSVSPCW